MTWGDDLPFGATGLMASACGMWVLLVLPECGNCTVLLAPLKQLYTKRTTTTAMSTYLMTCRLARPVCCKVPSFGSSTVVSTQLSLPLKFTEKEEQQQSEGQPTLYFQHWILLVCLFLDALASLGSMLESE